MDLHRAGSSPIISHQDRVEPAPLDFFDFRGEP